MKYFDYVKVINDRKEYAEDGIKKGMVGVIFNEVIRDNYFFVMFPRLRNGTGDVFCSIKIEDLEYVGPSPIVVTEEELLETINKYAWCIVEDGYIKNLNGDKKNKIPYDYDS